MLNLTFDEVVLRAFLHSLDGHEFVIETREHNQRRVGRGGVRLTHGIKPLDIGKAKIKQNDVDRKPGDIVSGGAHTLYVDQHHPARAVLVEHLANQTCVAWIVFNKKNNVDRFPAHPLYLCCGNLTLVSQKSLMLLTTLSNSSSCTGLLR